MMCCTLHDTSATLPSVRVECTSISRGLGNPATNPAPDYSNQLHPVGGVHPPAEGWQAGAFASTWHAGTLRGCQ